MALWLLRWEQAKFKRELGEMRARLEGIRQTYVVLEEITDKIRSTGTP